MADLSAIYSVWVIAKPQSIWKWKDIVHDRGENLGYPNFDRRYSRRTFDKID